MDRRPAVLRAQSVHMGSMIQIKTSSAPREADDVLWAVYDEPLMTLIAVVPTEGQAPTVFDLADAGLDRKWIQTKQVLLAEKRVLFHAGPRENPNQDLPVWQARPVEVTGVNRGRLHFQHVNGAIHSVGTTLPMITTLPGRDDLMSEEEVEPFTLAEVQSVLEVLGLEGEIEERESGFVVQLARALT